METVFTKNDLSLSAFLIETYPNGKLFFLQDRLLITDLSNNEVDSMDVINFTQQAF